ncbi:PD-(D/E)XK nuclease family protein [Ramlibacter sp. USB13]|uniref:PD-(D/E)XK nuclease family protein n=1 Tax=Ramlibacter cellulosilyticus TaxID=2764187 RepID=A0A923SAU8_9BURK|nr:PD-(D/E)XK nuclease family protein [Ramlibacter cellulosilyticus]MBC5782638.1 PD-(D/E)XK nuclease family protein [Ramlibacter cellulosilyticus]
MTEHEDGLLSLLEAVEAFEREHDVAERFNFFDAVGMKTQEIRHSRFIGYLLNPSEAHGLGDRFLKAFLLDVVAVHPEESPLSRLTVAVADLSGAFVYYERDHFDITIHVPTLRLLVVIENKIRASERDKQLSDYRDRAKVKYHEDNFMGVFLTPDGYDGEDGAWACIGYRRIKDTLHRVLREAAPHPRIADAIGDYLHLLEREVVVSEELVNACKKIYAQHRQAFDLIIEHGQVSALGEAFKTFAQDVSEVEAFSTRPNDVFFVARDWLTAPELQVADKERWGSSFPAKFWFHREEEKLSLCVEVGPVLDGSSFDRARFVRELRARFKEKDKKFKSSFTRIRTYKAKVEDDLDPEAMHSEMVRLWRQMGANEAIDHVFEAAKASVAP